jgi:hypothetical protein
MYYFVTNNTKGTSVNLIITVWELSKMFASLWSM